MDFESEELDALVLPNAVRQFGSIVDAQVELHGLCAKCQREARKASKQNKGELKKRSIP